MNGMSMRKLGSIMMLAAVALVCGPSMAEAHVGVGPVHDLLHGLERPVTGIASICAIVAIGIWAARRRWVARPERP